MTAAVVTAAAIVVLGPMPYVAYLETLTHASGTAWAFPGNLGLSASAPQLLLPASAGAIGLFLVLIWRSRDESAMLMWSLLVGLIAAPYVPFYAPVPVLAGVFPFVRAHPIRALAIAAIVVPLVFFNLMAATIVAMVLTVPFGISSDQHRRPSARSERGRMTSTAGEAGVYGPRAMTLAEFLAARKPLEARIDPGDHGPQTRRPTSHEACRPASSSRLLAASARPDYRRIELQ